MNALVHKLSLLADAEQRFAINQGMSQATESFILFIDNEADIYNVVYEALQDKRDRIIVIQFVRRLLSTIAGLPWLFQRWRKFMEFYELEGGVTMLLLFHVNAERVADHILANMEWTPNK